MSGGIDWAAERVETVTVELTVQQVRSTLAVLQPFGERFPGERHARAVAALLDAALLEYEERRRDG